MRACEAVLILTSTDSVTKVSGDGNYVCSSEKNVLMAPRKVQKRKMWIFTCRTFSFLQSAYDYDPTTVPSIPL